MAKKIDDLIVKIRFKTAISWYDAIKLRLAGGKAIAKHLEKTIDNFVPEKTTSQKGMPGNLLCGQDKVCGEIAKSLGIKHCRWLQIDMHVGEVVTVKAEFYPEIDGMIQCDTIFKQYELIEKKDENEED
jgi:hypothetical protein